jgi:hypothetical protein
MISTGNSGGPFTRRWSTVNPWRRHSDVLGREGGEEVGELRAEIARRLPLASGVALSRDGPRIGGRPLSDLVAATRFDAFRVLDTCPLQTPVRLACLVVTVRYREVPHVR